MKSTSVLLLVVKASEWQSKSLSGFLIAGYCLV